MFDRPRTAWFLAGALLLCAGCAAPPRPGGEAGGGGTPGAGGGPPGAYQVVASDVTVKVYRDGPLARLGHNHVVATTAVSGWVALREPLESSSFSLALPLDSLQVDDPARRSAAGADFPGSIPEADRDGTRRNLLGPALLDAARFPVLQLESVAVAAATDGYRVTARVEVAGVARQVTLPAVLQRRGSELVVSGEFVLTHAELGLTPFAAGLGALRVREDLEIAYRLRARRDAS